MTAARKVSSKVLNAGFATLGLLGLFASAANGAEKTLLKFRGGSGGEFPSSSLILAGSGDLYGTTGGGGNSTCQSGCGTVFKVTQKGDETVIYAFGGGSDGEVPEGPLTADPAGNLYGTTLGGGGKGCQSDNGCGTVFKLAPDGTESILYAFQGGSDGFAPRNGLVIDTNGNLYGVTLDGGSYNGADCDVVGCGTVFEVEPNGTKLTLHSFEAGNDGIYPEGVIVDGSGNLYGATDGGGGSACGGEGCGTVFKITPDGTETVLYAFQGGSDGNFPFAGVIMDDAGNLYGTTTQGGNCTIQFYAKNCGTVYKVTPDGTETILYSFQGGNDGLDPWAPLIMDKSGNLYGTTFLGGGDGCKNPLAPAKTGYGCGTVFKLAPGGKETVLYAFVHPQGANPEAGLLAGGHGELYGMAPVGGKSNYGVVFEVKK